MGLIELTQRVRSAIEKRLAGSTVVFDSDSSDRVYGVVSWQGFAPMDQVERQRHLTETLEQALTPDEMLHVGVLLTMTPDELADDNAA